MSTDITVQELNNKIARIAELRAKEQEASLAKKVITEELESEEASMIEALNALEMTSHKGPAGGVSISHRTSVKTPKTLEAKNKLFDYLRAKGLFDTMVSVNSQTLNSFYKAEMEQAIEAGNSEFQIPGLDEVTVSQTLSFRRN